MATKKTSRRKYGPATSKSVESAMRRRKRGTLKRGKGGKGGKVKSRKQAIAIGLSEAREKGAKAPSKPRSRSKSSGRKSTARKSGARKSTARKSSARKSGARKSSARKSSARKSGARKSSGAKKR